MFAVDDAHHARYDNLVAEAAADGVRLVTTWPCIVEASYVLDAPWRFELLEWVERGGVQVFPFDSSHLAVMLPWMRRYTEKYKRDMDLADASLLWLGYETGLREIMTVDVKDFSRYRLPDGDALTLLETALPGRPQRNASSTRAAPARSWRAMSCSLVPSGARTTHSTFARSSVASPPHPAQLLGTVGL